MNWSMAAGMFIGSLLGSAAWDVFKEWRRRRAVRRNARIIFLGK